jgi:hypothetical protein
MKVRELRALLALCDSDDDVELVAHCRSEHMWIGCDHRTGRVVLGEKRHLLITEPEAEWELLACR